MAQRSTTAFEKLYDAELKKLNTHTEALPNQYQELLAPTLENLAWMKAKLDETRALLQTDDVVIATDDGPLGNGTLRKNPGFEAYAQLLDRYMRAMKSLLDLLATVKTEPERKGTTLADIQKRRSSKAGKPDTNKKRRT